MKKISLLASMVALCAWLCGCNKQIIDMTYAYNYAYIDIPGGSVVEGPIQSWKDYEEGDQIQVKINDVVYLTDTTRCVLVAK